MLEENNVVEMHENIEAPIINWIKCQKFSLMDSAIGSDLGSFQARFNNLKLLISQSKTDMALKELRNQEHLFWHCINEVSPDLLAYSALVKSIDGEEIKIATDEDVYTVSNRLKELGITKETILTNEPKKKISDEMEDFFTESKKGFEAFAAQKKKLMIQCDEIIDNEDYSERIFSEDAIIVRHARILSFDGQDAEHIRYEKEFYKICTVLDTEVNRSSKEMSIRDWYLAKEFYNEKYKKAS